MMALAFALLSAAVVVSVTLASEPDDGNPEASGHDILERKLRST